MITETQDVPDRLAFRWYASLTCFALALIPSIIFGYTAWLIVASEAICLVLALGLSLSVCVRAGLRQKGYLLAGLSGCLGSAAIAGMCAHSFEALPQAIEARLTHEITWTLDSSSESWSPSQVARLNDDFEQRLNHPSGWVRAGINFRHVNRPAEAAIVLLLVAPADINSDCNSRHALPVFGCTETVVNGVCRIKFGLEVVGPARQVAPGTWTINHELGHCFGLDHEPAGLMQPFILGEQEKYPSETQVATARKNLFG